MGKGKQVLFIGISLLLTGCGLIETPEAEIRIVEVPMKRVEGRQGRYEKCLLELNLAGIRQDLLKTLCDAAHGSNDVLSGAVKGSK